jgi:hypothetical protein
MKRIMHKTAVSFVFCHLLVTVAMAQATTDTTKIWRIETTDGNEFYGPILFRDNYEVKLKTEILGFITIQHNHIKSISEVQQEELKEGEIWLKFPQDARYFYAPNGYGLRKGEAYYQNTWVLFNQASVGITNNISLGAGILPLFLFAGSPTPVWITPKFYGTVIKDKFNVGAGALLGVIMGEGGGAFGIPYGVTTFGSRDKNVSLGVGWGFTSEGWADKPMYNLSGMIRTGKKGYFLTENYLLQIEGDNYLVISFGGRTVWPRVSLDYGLFLPMGIDEFVAIPWLGITIPLGKK